MNSIKSNSQIINWLDDTKSYQLLTGQVQSGKTIEIINYCYWSIYEQRKSVLVVFQNIKYDIQQFNFRLQNFNKNVKELRPLYAYTIDDFDNSTPKLYVALGNYLQIGKCLNIIDIEFNMCLDEADLLVKSGNRKTEIEKVFHPLKRRASHILGVTATNLAILFHEESLSNIKILSTPQDYHGYDKLNKIAIPSNIIIGRNLAYESFNSKETGLMLHIEKHRKNDQLMLSDELHKEYPTILFIVYNGDGIYLFPHRLRRTITGGDYPDEHIFNYRRKITISALLQKVKESEIKKISIISGRMAGRGVSFVSEDFQFHITDQLYLPSSSIHDESMAQHLRILGRYQECQLNLYTKKSIINKLNKNYETRDTCNDNLQRSNERLYETVGTARNGRRISLVAAITQVPLNTITKKFSRPKVCKHIKFKTQGENIYFDGLEDISDEEN